MTLTDITQGACWACPLPGRPVGISHLHTCPRHAGALDGLREAIRTADRLGALPEHIRIAAWVLAQDAVERRQG